MGCFFMNSAIGTGEPIGPILAILNAGTILTVSIDAIRFMEMPNWLQLIGLISGLLGAFILTIPDHVKAAWTLVTRCKWVPPVH